MRPDHANQFTKPHGRQACELPSDDKPMPRKPSPRNLRIHAPPPPHRDTANLVAVLVCLLATLAVLWLAFGR